jgi:hypothetical protein
MECPNCFRQHRKLKEVCMTRAFAAMLLDDLDEKQAAELMYDLDVNTFWDDVGPIIDRLRDGHYRVTPSLLDEIHRQE